MILAVPVNAKLKKAISKLPMTGVRVKIILKIFKTTKNLKHPTSRSPYPRPIEEIENYQGFLEIGGAGLDLSKFGTDRKLLRARKSTFSHIMKL